LPKKKGNNVEETLRDKNYILRRNSYRGSMPTNELKRLFEDIEVAKKADRDRKEGERDGES